MSKYAIGKIYGVKLIIPKVEIINKNVPYKIQVTEEKYRNFINENEKYIKESYNNTTVDSFVVKDFYGNIIASVYYYMETNYYINPELLKLGIEKKVYIEDEIKKIGEDIIELGELKSCKIGN